jgi:hypothetical protein
MKTEKQMNEQFGSIDFSNRDFLIEMRQAALSHSMTPAMDSYWKRAFIQLADAFDRIDAMVARTELK